MINHNYYALQLVLINMKKSRVKRSHGVQMRTGD